MTGRALLLASAFVAALVALATEKAGAASWLEKNFYLSGPQYEGKLPPCDYRDALTLIASRFNQKENMYWVTDLRIVNFERIRETAFRPWAANSIPAPLLQRGRRGHRRPQACHPLFDLRRHRDDRRQLGDRVVRGRPRSQLVLQPGLQDGAAVVGFIRPRAAAKFSDRRDFAAGPPREPASLSVLFPLCSWNVHGGVIPSLILM